MRGLAALLKTSDDQPEVGEAMPEDGEYAGWVCGGVSETTGKPFYISTKSTVSMTFEDAAACVVGGGFRLPSEEEMIQLKVAFHDGSLLPLLPPVSIDPDAYYWMEYENPDYPENGRSRARFNEAGFTTYLESPGTKAEAKLLLVRD